MSDERAMFCDHGERTINGCIACVVSLLKEIRDGIYAIEALVGNKPVTIEMMESRDGTFVVKTAKRAKAPKP